MVAAFRLVVAAAFRPLELGSLERARALDGQRVTVALLVQKPVYTLLRGGRWLQQTAVLRGRLRLLHHRPAAVDGIAARAWLVGPRAATRSTAKQLCHAARPRPRGGSSGDTRLRAPRRIDAGRQRGPVVRRVWAGEGLGIVVPHRAQRAALQEAFPELCVIDAATGLPARSAIDTVERFQGGERTVVLVSATGRTCWRRARSCSTRGG